MDVSTFFPASCAKTIGDVNVKQGTNGSQLTFVDFMPQCLEPGGIFTEPTYESFRALIDKSNRWLSSNSGWEVRTCETTEFRKEISGVEREKMTYFEYKDRLTAYVRGLRLWLVPRTPARNSAQQIGYVNLVPQKVGEPSIFGTPSYEPLGNVLERFNNWIRTKPITGRIINMECQKTIVNRSGDLYPDQMNWCEHGDTYKQFVFVLRVYYDITTAVTEEIGVADFLPNKISEGGIFTWPKYEPFSNTVWKASEWCRQQSNVRICNVQCLNVKVKSGDNQNTQKMSYTEYGKRRTLYIRILRVFYTKPSGYLIGEDSSHKPVYQLTCKTFVPVQIATGIFNPEFESLSQTKTRVEAWIRATGAEVISSETLALKLARADEVMSGVGSSSTHSTDSRTELYTFVIRVFLNGTYYEPPSEMLPPIPEITDKGCCVLS